ncbi:conjugal transfer protein TraA [Kosakonia sacchari]|uniref:type IV conjugative transfer system pilin TraA n=1 Tax=Kosakonia sacchari TaxID=1158459 RepID=UPI0025B11E14|nr:type IV conjugative transfer system pilin TraA [Kosakonia sacchari]MDN2488140.1 conjugal transfer protein TraA [Kosakonia sacchari]
MFKQDNALNVKQGWAVASLFRNIARKINLSRGGKLTAASAPLILAGKNAWASATDLLAGQNMLVYATFGSDSSIIKWFYIAEIIFSLFLFIKARNPMIFLGLIGILVFTRVAFGIAS